MTLRARLLVGMAVVALVLAGASVAITRTTEDHLVRQVDEQLVTSGPRFERVDGPGGSEDPGGRDELSTLYVGVVDRTGQLRTVLRPNLLHDDPPLPALTAGDVLHATPGQPFTVGSIDSATRYRVVADRDPRGVVLALGLPLDDIDAAVDRLRAVAVLVTLAVLAVLGLVTWWVIRLGVRPLKQMTSTATAIAGGDLSYRMPDAADGTEAAELGTALNTMLGRIQAAFDERGRSEDRLRQFVADASHELRTPVTTIRGYAELHRAGGLADPNELAEAMRRTEQEAVRMGTLVDDLLLLARLDQGRPLERAPVDLAPIAADAVRDARAVQPDRLVTALTDGPVPVLGDDGRLRQVVANLVGNALVHTPPGTAVEVRASRAGDRAVLEIADAGPGMDPEVAAQAFDRFFRGDPSRSRHRGGSGLGLAIVQATVAAHGGTVGLHTAPGWGTVVRVELPLSS
jgi:two-component system OmpR family sensor kinase